MIWIRSWTTVVVAVACSGTRLATAATVEISGYVLSDDCTVDVPAREAGVVSDIKIREGMTVPKDAILATLDLDQAQMEERKARSELEQARAKAASEVDLRYAEAAHAKAKQDLERKIKANGKDDRIKPHTDEEIAAAELEVKKTGLQIDQAKLERDLSRLTSEAKQVECDAASHAIERRRIRCLLEGDKLEVLEVCRQKGEWMNPGDVLARVVRIDTLTIAGYLEHPRERGVTEGTPVEVIVERKDGTQSLAGKIIHIRPEMEREDQLEKNRICVEVRNREVNGSWLLQLKQKVKMRVVVRGLAD